MTHRAFLSRHERFPLVGSTNDVVRGWLADGTPEVCLAVADEQSAGRGREGRSWQALAGAALLLSLGFRPTWLLAEQAWRLAAITSLAMAEAAEEVAELPAGAIRLKWPNDLIVERDDRTLKVAGVLGETDGLGTPDPRVVVGIGINADWKARDFPSDIAGSMTSLRELAGGRQIDPTRLLEAFTGRLGERVDALRDGRFGGAGWASRQATTGRTVTLETHDGRREVQAVGVNEATGALEIRNPDGTDRSVVSAEVIHLRLTVAAARV